VVWFYHPENVETILNSNVHITKSKEYVFLQPWLGTGLLLVSYYFLVKFGVLFEFV
jgi:hypothetical protein